MESLLALSFDNISSRDHAKIRKGLRQIEGLLAQICLSSARSSPRKRDLSGLQGAKQDDEKRGKRLGDLRKDPAFREFFRLQENFQWNVASRLLQALERIMGTTGEQTDVLILSVLDLLLGFLLLHPPSRCLFASDQIMNTVLDLLDPTLNTPDIQSRALLALVAALMGEPRNARVLENVDGLLTLTSLFKNRATTQEVKMRTLEFLYFYLMPEHPPRASASLHTPEKAGRRRPHKLGVPALHARTHSGEMEMDEPNREAAAAGTKTMEEKQKLLGKHLSDVADLVRDLQESPPLGITALDVG